jgi:CPA2 family monovalent cation:H+ antiporter-2
MGFGMVVGTPIFLWMGIPLYGALLLSLSIAMSSSVVIVNITRSPRRATDTQTEEALLGWSLVQDIVGVAAAAIVLTLFGSSNSSIFVAVGGLIAFGAIAIVASRILPIVLRAVRWDKDFFLIYSVSFGLVLASLGTVVFEIPMALAGFVAGLAINNSRDSEEVRKAILPFRDLFAVLFFVVIGTLIQPSLLEGSWRFALLILGLMIILKTLPIMGLAHLSSLKVKPMRLGIGVSQIGEFSFVLGSLAYAEKVISVYQYTGLLMAVVLSIMASTILVRRAPKHA